MVGQQRLGVGMQQLGVGGFARTGRLVDLERRRRNIETRRTVSEERHALLPARDQQVARFELLDARFQGCCCGAGCFARLKRQ